VKVTIAILIIEQTNKAHFVLFGEATVTPIPIPKIKKAPKNAMNILGVITNFPIFKGFNFIGHLVLIIKFR
jgi:hypothetical protein